MKKKNLNLQLYKDAFKQLKVIGFASLGITLLVSCLLLAGTIINYSNPEYMMYASLPMNVYIMDGNPLLVLNMFIVAPIMVLNIFSFLNKRNASDFYHAIPQKRSHLYLCFYGAVITWLLLIILIPSATSLIIMQVFSKLFIVNWLKSIIVIFNVIAGSLFVSGAVAIAMCLSGTTFTNIIVSGLIIFMPRIILLVYTNMLESSLPILSSDHFLPILSSSNNVATGLIFTVFTYESASVILTSVSSGIYSLIIGIIYSALAMWLFHRRKSESAGYSAPNKGLQLVYRLSLAMLVCLIPCVSIFDQVANDYGYAYHSRNNLFVLVMMYLAAIIVYFLYELITTKKLKNLVKAIPGLGILAIMNLIMIGALFLGYNSIISYKPAAEEIKSVQLVAERSYWSDSYDYFEGQSEQIKLDNPEIKEIFARQLTETVDMVNDKIYNFYNSNYTIYTVAINTSFQTKYRNVMLTRSDVEKVAEILSQQEDYHKVYMELPDVNETNVALSMWEAQLPYDSIKNIYSTLVNEISSMEFEEWYSILNNYNEKSHRITTISAEYSIGAKTYTTDLPITTATPETFKALQEALADENAGKLAKITELLSSPEKASDISFTQTAYNIGGNTNEISSTYFYIYEDYVMDGESKSYMGNMGTTWKQTLKELAGQIETKHGQPIDLSAPYLYLDLTIYYEENNINQSLTYNAYLPIDLLDLPAVLQTDGIY